MYTFIQFSKIFTQNQNCGEKKLSEHFEVTNVNIIKYQYNFWSFFKVPEYEHHRRKRSTETRRLLGEIDLTGS